MGAEWVVTDAANGNVRHRPGYRILCKVLRAGDRLILDHPRSLGTKPEYHERNAVRIEAMGAEVCLLKPPGGR